MLGLNHTVLVRAAVLLVCTTCSAAHADVRDFPFTYEWFQNAKGEHELAYHLEYSDHDGLLKHELEYEYGVTHRLSLAPYVVFKSGAGRSLHYDAVKLETRYQLGTFEVNRLLPGLYLELEQANHEAFEIEGKLILSRYDTRSGNLSLNLIGHRQLGSGNRTEISLSAAFARQLGRGIRGGAEAIHEFSTGTLRVGPVVSMPAGPVHLTAGYAIPLSGRHAGGQFRLLVEKHF